MAVLPLISSLGLCKLSEERLSGKMKTSFILLINIVPFLWDSWLPFLCSCYSTLDCVIFDPSNPRHLWGPARVMGDRTTQTWTEHRSHQLDCKPEKTLPAWWSDFCPRKPKCQAIVIFFLELLMPINLYLNSTVHWTLLPFYLATVPVWLYLKTGSAKPTANLYISHLGGFTGLHFLCLIG